MSEVRLHCSLRVLATPRFRQIRLRLHRPERGTRWDVRDVSLVPRSQSAFAVASYSSRHRDPSSDPWDSVLHAQGGNTTMTSADFCRDFGQHPCCPCPVFFQRLRDRPPGVRRVSLRRSVPDLPHDAPVSIGRRGPMPPYPRRTGLVSGFCSSRPAFAAGFLRTLPRDDALAFGYGFRSPRPREDLHLM